MDIAEPKLMCIVNKHSIGIGNVQAHFDDIGAHQHIRFAVNKIQQSALQVFGFQLPVSHGDFHSGALFPEHFGEFRQGSYPVVNKKHLTAPVYFIIDGISYGFFIKSHAFCMYRLAVGRRCAHDRHIPG